MKNHIKYLENFLDILYLPLEILLALPGALGGRIQMNSIIWANMASGFQVIQLQEGALRDQSGKGENGQGIYSPGSFSAIPWFGKGCMFFILGHVSCHKVPINILPLILQDYG